jgi:hypothetical protein
MYANQVGGHTVLVKPLESSIVLKPYDEAEFDFYDRCVPLICSALMPFTARCYGEVDLRSITPEHGGSSVIPGKSGKFVMLEDLAHGIARPCILDLKMGLKQRSIRNYSEKKVQSKQEKSISTTSHSLGFRLCGAQLYYNNNVTFYNKYFGRLQDAEGTYSILRAFFESVNDVNLRGRIVDLVIRKLEELRVVIRSLTGFRFWSGSLLLIVDSALSTEGADETLEGSVILKMIDFANYTQLEGTIRYDEEYDFGIECLLEFSKGIRKNDTVSTVLSRVRPPPDPSVQDRELLSTVERYRKKQRS